MQHVIRKQIIELNLQKDIDAFQIQHRISKDYWDVVVPVLTNVFDQYANEDEVIKIDQLEIDLGILKIKTVIESHWTKGIFDRILTALKTRLNEDQTENKQLKVPIDLNIFQQWLFYLEHGYFLWNTTEITGDWEKGIIQTLTENEVQLKKFIYTVKKYPQVALRIVMQHKQQFLLKLVEVMNAKKPDSILTLIENLSKQLAENVQRPTNNSGADLRIIQIKIWHLIFLAIVNYPIFISPVQFISAILTDKKALFLVEVVPEPFIPNYIPILSDIQQLLKELQIHMPNTETTEKKIEAFKKRYNKGKTTRQSRSNTNIDNGDNKKESDKSRSDTGPFEDITLNILPVDESDHTEKKGEAFKKRYNKGKIRQQSRSNNNINNRDNKKGSLKNKSDAEPFEDISLNIFSLDDVDAQSFSEAIDTDGIFVTNAGIVLLYPFLSMFYDYLELLDKQEFKTMALRQKAVILLQYLATGASNPPEFELTIAKVMCAFPSNSPIDTALEISKNDIEECETLLSTVIERWEALKGSSIIALREGFLQRGGHLFKKNGELHLRIEQRSIDLLLDHIPWTISMIKLPWMNTILYVEWR